MMLWSLAGSNTALTSAYETFSWYKRYASYDNFGFHFNSVYCHCSLTMSKDQQDWDKLGHLMTHSIEDIRPIVMLWRILSSLGLFHNGIVTLPQWSLFRPQRNSNPLQINLFRGMWIACLCLLIVNSFIGPPRIFFFFMLNSKFSHPPTWDNDQNWSTQYQKIDKIKDQFNILSKTGKYTNEIIKAVC